MRPSLPKATARKYRAIAKYDAGFLDPVFGAVWPKELPEDVQPAWMKKLGGGQRRGWMSH